MASLSTIAPAYAGADPFLRDANRGALIRNTNTVVEEPVVEHEHHHLHHHIDHGDVNARLALSRVAPAIPARPGLGREYSYDDLDVKERRYPNGVTVSTIRETRDGYHRHRHRHRHGRHGSVDRRFARSDIDLNYDTHRRRGSLYEDEERDDFTVVDVPPGSKRILVNVEKERESREPGWRRDRGVRRSRGLGNELWTEITKDLITKEAIEEMGLPYEETDFFFYIFEYLGREQIDELVDITADLRRERVRDIEYESIAGSTPRMLPSRYEREVDTRTEIIVESDRSSRHRDRSRPRRRYYY